MHSGEPQDRFLRLFTANDGAIQEFQVQAGALPT
jgi:hypothetical protein